MQRYIGRQPVGEEPMNIQEPSNQKNPVNIPQGDSIVLKLKDIFYLCISKWYWFLLSLAIALTAGYYYIKTTPPVYQRSIAILIKSKESANEPILEEMGFTNTPSNLTNEMELLKTGPIAYEIARRLDLNVEYIRQGRFHDDVLYGIEAPVKISFLSLPEYETASLHLKLDKDGEITLYDLSDKEQTFNDKITVAFNDTVDTPLGNIVVTPSASYKLGKTADLTIRHSNINNIIGRIQSKISPSLRKKNSTIIDINYKDVSRARAEDILNTLVGVYNENWIKDRNIKTQNTDKFIKDRLAFIEDELGNVEQNISAWKSRNLMLDVGAAGSFAQSQINEAERDLQELNNQIYMTKYIKEYLEDGKHEHQLLPVNSGITNSSIESLIKQYNDKLLIRNNHLANSSAQNPLVRDLDEDLEVLRGSISQSLDYELAMLQSKSNVIKSRQGVAVSRVATNPEKAQQLLSEERQQKVKEQLYLYLLEKREENELSQAFGAYNNQFIESPHGSNNPVEPETGRVWMICFATGLFFPAFIIFATEMLNTKVRGKNDLKSLSAPYAGDIPLHEPKKKNLVEKFKKKEIVEIPKVLVAEKKRDVINEAFRVIRTNVEFILGFDSHHKVIMLTSLTPGSGKTFISVNLATAFAIRDKKVLLIDLDLRKGSLSQYLDNPSKGISNYLSGQVVDFRELIKPLGKLDMLPCGTLPPNPAELLFTPRFQEMMVQVREEYDYIFLDCPPVEVVADASIISSYADLTLFVIRIGNMERDNLYEVEEWYQNRKFGKLAVLLNGIKQGSSRYGYHKYGYHKYGYHYGN
ncbi:MAG: polysaccharide biosynthesis tyrosine autokinase [Muribaculaceae bacterium]|nr:polysaccharide biosynthesis tyrosine autokinase [Muribaculaceae bacterium]